MKISLKHAYLAFALTLVISACSSNKTEDRTSDSIDSVNDSIQNDTGAFDITSQGDSTLDSAANSDTSGM